MVIRRLKALLHDAQSQLEKSKDASNHKSNIRTLETQLEDSQSALTAALKSKRSLELELQESQQQQNAANRYADTCLGLYYLYAHTETLAC